MIPIENPGSIERERERCAQLCEAKAAKLKNDNMHKWGAWDTDTSVSKLTYDLLLQLAAEIRNGPTP